MFRDRDRRSVIAPVAALVVFALHPAEARAYLDAGAGSMIFQAVLGAAVAGIVIVRTYWRRVLGHFRKNPCEQERTGTQKDI